MFDRITEAILENILGRWSSGDGFDCDELPEGGERKIPLKMLLKHIVHFDYMLKTHSFQKEKRESQSTWLFLFRKRNILAQLKKIVQESEIIRQVTER